MATSKSLKKSETLNINSYIRVRPLGPNEKKSNNIEFTKHEVLIKSSPDVSKSSKTYTFNRVFGEDSKQVIVYSNVAKPMIKEVIKGYNCTIFAYGQTGTGKTYTMLGSNGDVSGVDMSWENNTDAGIIPRILEDMFTELDEQNCEYQVTVSFMELYNEKLRNLLNYSEDEPNIQLIDDLDGGVVIKGLVPVPVKTRDEAFRLLQNGTEKKQVAATLMNTNSSRSHTIFTITVNIKESVLDKEDILRLGKLHLVDLAGSENVSKSGASDIIHKTFGGQNRRLTEASNINKSLLTLGRVITSLTENHAHIPYRESKLTRFLRDSLGGKTKTCIIATVSPSQTSIEETESTLNYALKARSIKNKPEKNQTISKKDFMQAASEEILKLKRDLEAVRQGDGFYISQETHEEMVENMRKLEVQVKDWSERYDLLNASFVQHRETFKLLNEDYEDKCAEYDDLCKLYENESVKFKDQIADVKKEITVREYFIQEYKKTEKNLTDQAKTCKSVLENILEQNWALHDRISNKKKNENRNIGALNEFKSHVCIQLDELNKTLAEYSKEEHEFVNGIHNFAGGVMDLLNNHKVKTTSLLEDFQLKGSGELEVLHQTRDRMVSEMTQQLDSHETLLNDTVTNQVNVIDSCSCWFKDKVQIQMRQQELLCTDLNRLTENLKTLVEKSSVLGEFLETTVMKVNSFSSEIRASFDHFEEYIDKSYHYSNFSKQETEKALQKMIMIQKDVSDVQNTLTEALSKTTGSLNYLSDARESNEKYKNLFDNFLIQNDDFNCKLKDKLADIETFASHQHSISAKTELPAYDIKTKLLVVNKKAAAKFDSVSQSLRGLSDVSVQNKRSLIKSITDSSQAFGKATVDGYENRAQFCDNFKEYLNTFDGDIEQYLRNKCEDNVSHKCRVDNFTEATIQQNVDLKRCVNEMNYSVDPSQGSTPPRIKKTDLKYPKDFDSTAPHEVLSERFRQISSHSEEQSQSNSEVQPSSSNCKFVLRRSTSLPDVHNLKTTDEDKENVCQENVSLPKKGHLTNSTQKKPKKIRHILGGLN